MAATGRNDVEPVGDVRDGGIDQNEGDDHQQQQNRPQQQRMSLKKAASRTKSLSLSGDDFPLRPAKPRAAFVTAKRPEDTAKIMKYIDDSVIGKGVAFLGPFGRRKGGLKNFNVLIVLNIVQKILKMNHVIMPPRVKVVRPTAFSLPQ